MSSFIRGSKYSFTTHAPALLGGSVFNNLKLIGIMDYELAENYSNIPAQHANIYPYLPPDTINDYTKYTYLLFKDINNRTILLADAWIVTSSIKQVFENKLVVVITNPNNETESKLREILTLSGYNFSFVLDK